jgi:hypothetical protein
MTTIGPKGAIPFSEFELLAYLAKSIKLREEGGAEVAMTSKRTSPIMAGEFHALLEKDPDWVAMRHAKDEEIAKRRAESQREEAPIIADLAAAGVHAKFVSDLVNRRNDYDSALPVLMRHLLLDYCDRTKEMIARSLAVPEAAPYWAELLAMYENEPSRTPDGKESDVKSGLSVALSVLGKRHPEEIVRLCSDARNGASRVTLIQAIRRNRAPWIDDALARLVEDPGLAVELARWGRMKKKAG